MSSDTTTPGNPARGANWPCPACGGEHYLTNCTDPRARGGEPEPIPMLLWCPGCGERHIDEGEFATRRHTTHACQSCGMVWRPALVATVGVRFLPGYKNEEKAAGKPARKKRRA